MVTVVVVVLLRALRLSAALVALGPARHTGRPGDRGVQRPAHPADLVPPAHRQAAAEVTVGDPDGRFSESILTAALQQGVVLRPLG